MESSRKKTGIAFLITIVILTLAGILISRGEFLSFQNRMTEKGAGRSFTEEIKQESPGERGMTYNQRDHQR